MVEFTILALKRPFQVVGLGPSHQYRLSGLQDKRSNPPGYRAFVGLRDVDDGRWSAHAQEDLRHPQQSTNSLARPEGTGLLVVARPAFLIRVAALLASTSFSKPNTAAYLPTAILP